MAGLAERLTGRYKGATQADIGKVVIYRVSGERGEEQAIQQGKMRRGDCLPAMIVRVHLGNEVNLKVFCDGHFDAWMPAVSQGDRPGEWNWAAGSSL